MRFRLMPLPPRFPRFLRLTECLRENALTLFRTAPFNLPPRKLPNFAPNLDPMAAQGGPHIFIPMAAPAPLPTRPPIFDFIFSSTRPCCLCIVVHNYLILRPAASFLRTTASFLRTRPVSPFSFRTTWFSVFKKVFRTFSAPARIRSMLWLLILRLHDRRY